ncbi:Protein FAR1-RELATED SEQUENCE [Psidium guajava]|nr:Protein FAR1-RELATED SEQUENCE [Psidium guajava]
MTLHSLELESDFCYSSSEISYEYGSQGKLIKVIVQEVLSKLKARQRNLPDHFLGMDDQVEAVMNLLDTYSMDARSVIIHGMGGIGKTTLAKAIFDKIYSQFESCSFLSNVQESLRQGDIVKLQKQLLSDILKSRSIEINDNDDRINMLRKRCLSNKVLIVLDDIGTGDQLINLGGMSDWFRFGSRIIITTKNMRVLYDNFRVQSQEFYIYEMREMLPKHALQLFSLCTFGTDFPPRDFNRLSREVVNTVGGLPLALEVVGSFLHRKGDMIWKETLKKLQKMPCKEVQKKLMISYEALEDKEIFFS